MMRKTIFAAALTGILVFSAASLVMAGSLFKSAKTVGLTFALPVDSVNQTETMTQEEIFFDVVAEDASEIVTPYYRISFPESWKGAYAVKTVSNETGMWLKLHFNKNGKAAGHLFSILLTEGDTYKMIADYDLLGELEDREGNTYHVIAVFPTDVQYSLEDRENYQALYREAEAVLDTIEAAEGCKFTKAEKEETG